MSTYDAKMRGIEQFSVTRTIEPQTNSTALSSKFLDKLPYHVLPPEYAEGFLGDLYYMREDDVARYGKRKAAMLYAHRVLSLYILLGARNIAHKFSHVLSARRG